MGQQHRHRLQAVLAQQRVELLLDADAGVDHDALLALAGGDDVAVGPEGLRGEAADEHSSPPPGWRAGGVRA